ncbi:MAG: hypothetical protein LBC07_01930, partial [Elusimicrobiota bacterium]|nr:hypothetical protein [Elusimicrobiota bacterium]
FGAGNTVFLESLSISQIQDFSYMLLTSDGVHDYIKIDELEHLLTDQPSSIKTCLNIIQAALNAGSKDDISVVIIKE